MNSSNDLQHLFIFIVDKQLGHGSNTWTEINSFKRKKNLK
jgi:hypothetical protein